MYRKTILALSLLLFSGIGYSGSVGTAPGFIDLGEVQPGETIEHQIYVTTNFDNNFTVNPSFSDARTVTALGEHREERYDTSEEDISGWVELEQGALVNPDERYTAELDDGSLVNAYGEFQINIDIPNDAEPGYHYGRIRLNPQIEAQEGQAGSVNWGETVPNFRFRVSGDVDRSIEVQDVRSFRLGEDQAAIEVLLTNRGTVTVSTQRFEVDIYDSSRNELAQLSVSGSTLEPGESKWVETRWSNNDRIEGGSYEIDGEVDYFTGSAYASGSFSLPDFDVVEVRPDDSPAVDQDERESMPLWLVVMVLIVFGVLMWSFNIDPFWILLIVGSLGISAFVLMSGISNLLVLVLLMVIGIVVYGGL